MWCISNCFYNYVNALAIQNPVPNKVSLSSGYLQMLQCDDLNQQARQS